MYETHVLRNTKGQLLAVNELVYTKHILFLKKKFQLNVDFDKILSYRWIPHILTTSLKDAPVKWCKQMLKKYSGRASKDIYIVTGTVHCC